MAELRRPVRDAPRVSRADNSQQGSKNRERRAMAQHRNLSLSLCDDQEITP
jgi:hypothetical protein